MINLMVLSLIDLSIFPTAQTNTQELLECAERNQNKVFVQQLDQTKEDHILNLTEALRTRNYRLDLLVLNAGIAEHEHPNVNASQINRYVDVWADERWNACISRSVD